MAEPSKPQWIYEESFGEKRALLIENDQIVAARLHWHSKICAGTIAQAKVISRRRASSRGTCLTVSPEPGHEVLVPDLPTDASEGTEVRLIIHREPMAERGRLKRAHGRYLGDHSAPETAPNQDVLTKDEHTHRLPDGMWEDVWSLAAEGSLAFDGGSLVITPTPAMTLIDIDGSGSARELALAAIPAIAKAVRWLDLGGSIGIDFPTVQTKQDRKAIDAALDEALGDWPHERTAINGFGFVQLLSLIHI